MRLILVPGDQMTHELSAPCNAEPGDVVVMAKAKYARRYSKKIAFNFAAIAAELREVGLDRRR